MSHPTQHQKVILVVGGSSGFGELAARKLLSLEHTVYVAARRMDRLGEIEKHLAKLLKMDVTDNNCHQKAFSKC